MLQRQWVYNVKQSFLELSFHQGLYTPFGEGMKHPSKETEGTY